MATQEKKLVARHVGSYIRPIASLQDVKDRLKPTLYKLVSLDDTEYSFQMLIPGITGSVTLTIPTDTETMFLVMSRAETLSYLNQCAEALNMCSLYLLTQNRELQKMCHDCAMLAIRL